MNMAIASKETTKITSKSSTGRVEGITNLSKAEDWILAPPPKAPARPAKKASDPLLPDSLSSGVYLDIATKLSAASILALTLY